MVLAAEFGSGQVVWSIFWFTLFFVWIWLLISIFADIIRSGDLSGGAKALWAIGIIVLPYLGVFLYLIVRGGTMQDRAAAQAAAAEAGFRRYVKEVANSPD